MSYCRRGRPAPSEHQGALGPVSTSPYLLPPAPDPNIHKLASAGPPMIQLWAISGKNTARKLLKNTHCKPVDSIWPSNVARRSLGSVSPSPHPLTPHGTIPNIHQFARDGQIRCQFWNKNTGNSTATPRATK
jgi:hypothetical protein